MSHLAEAETPESESNRQQQRRFDEVLALLSPAERAVISVHLANSAGALHLPAARFDWVRLGIALYGYDSAGRLSGDLEPVLSVAAEIVQVKSIPAGTRVGYGGRWTAERPSRIGIVPVGYADGYSWRLGNRAEVLVAGRRVPVVGSVSMDLLAVDRHRVAAEVGSRVTLLGRQGAEAISAVELAAEVGTMPYQLLCLFGLRLPRRIVEASGQEVERTERAGPGAPAQAGQQVNLQGDRTSIPLEGYFTEMGRFFEILGRTFAWTFRPPYDFQQLTRQMVRIGVDSLPVVLLTALFTGMVMALQTFSTLKRFNAEGFVGSLVALSMVRELAPVISSLLIAGRCGSAMGAELGTMRVTEQIDALEVLATDPVHYLVVPRVWATVFMLPLLIVVADVIGIVGGYLISVVYFGANPVTYVENTFRFMDLADLSSGLIKAAVFGLIIAVVGCQKGYFTRGGAEGVGRATTRAVVLASIAILISDFFLTKILY